VTADVTAPGLFRSISTPRVPRRLPLRHVRPTWRGPCRQSDAGHRYPAGLGTLRQMHRAMVPLGRWAARHGGGALPDRGRRPHLAGRAAVSAYLHDWPGLSGLRCHGGDLGVLQEAPAERVSFGDGKWRNGAEREGTAISRASPWVAIFYVLNVTILFTAIHTNRYCRNLRINSLYKSCHKCVMTYSQPVYNLRYFCVYVFNVDYQVSVDGHFAWSATVP